jgi:O-antigen/teichoic acid export membrane protein
MNWGLQLLQKMTDSYGLTVNSEIASMFQRITGMVLIVIFFWFNLLQLTNLFYIYFMIMGLLIFSIVIIIQRKDYGIKLLALSLNQIKKYIKEFYQYSHPLFIYALVGLIAGIFDRWLLQVFGGSVEQAFYGLALQIGAGCFLFTSAMTPLLTREFSIAFGKQDLGQMAYLFRRYIPLLYSIAAYFSCFIAVQADKVIHIMGGKSFSSAVTAVTIMAFYPMHQTYGQLSGSVFYATGQTGLYRNIGIIFLIIGLLVSYFLMAPHQWFGLELGSVGLAIKTVLLGFFAINVQLWYNSKLLNLSFWEYFSHQIYSVAIFIFLGIITVYLTDMVVKNIILNLIVSGIIYTFIHFIILYLKPSLYFTSRSELEEKVKFIRNTLFKRED